MQGPCRAAQDWDNCALHTRGSEAVQSVSRAKEQHSKLLSTAGDDAALSRPDLEFIKMSFRAGSGSSHLSQSRTKTASLHPMTLNPGFQFLPLFRTLPVVKRNTVHTFSKSQPVPSHG